MSLGSIKEIRNLGEKCLPNDGRVKFVLYIFFILHLLIKIQQENDLVIETSAYLQEKIKARGAEFIGNNIIG